MPQALEHWQQGLRSIEPDLLAQCLARYGVEVGRVLELVTSDPSLARRVCPHHDYIEAELVHAFRHEFACTITDILARRTRIAWSSCQGLDLLSTLMALLQRYGGLSRAQVTRQVEAYHHFLLQGLAFRPPLSAASSWSDMEGAQRR